ncbi:MAG: hypothetical protein N2C12_17890 [Planctomycetales bacterium]
MARAVLLLCSLIIAGCTPAFESSQSTSSTSSQEGEHLQANEPRPMNSPSAEQNHPVQFMIESPPNYQDARRIVSELEDHDLHIVRVHMNLGTATYLLESQDVINAKAQARDIIVDEALTVRLEKDILSSIWEVYELGTKTGEADYRIKN